MREKGSGYATRQEAKKLNGAKAHQDGPPVVAEADGEGLPRHWQPSLPQPRSCSVYTRSLTWAIIAWHG